MKIPDGRTARAAWRALPRRERGEVVRMARQGWPHPDLEVARVAVGWARQARRHAQRILPLLYIPLVAQTAVPVNALPERYQLAALQIRGVLLLAALAALVPALAYAARHRHASKVEVVNLRALLAADRTAPSALTVHRAGRFGLPDLLAVAYVVLVTGFVVEALAVHRSASQAEPLPEDIPPGAERLVELEIAFTVVFILTTAFAAFLAFVVAPAILTLLLTQRPRGTGPLATVDAEGLTVPHLRLTLPWNEIAEVDVAFPTPHSRWSYVMGLWVLPRDPALIVARSGLPRWRRLLLSRWVSLCRRALFVPASWMREPPEAAVRAARTWSQPVMS